MAAQCLYVPESKYMVLLSAGRNRRNIQLCRHFMWLEREAMQTSPGMKVNRGGVDLLTPAKEGIHLLLGCSGEVNESTLATAGTTKAASAVRTSSPAGTTAGWSTAVAVRASIG